MIDAQRHLWAHSHNKEHYIFEPSLSYRQSPRHRGCTLLNIKGYDQVLIWWAIGIAVSLFFRAFIFKYEFSTTEDGHDLEWWVVNKQLWRHVLINPLVHNADTIRNDGQTLAYVASAELSLWLCWLCRFDDHDFMAWYFVANYFSAHSLSFNSIMFENLVCIKRIANNLVINALLRLDRYISTFIATWSSLTWNRLPQNTSISSKAAAFEYRPQTV